MLGIHVIFIVLAIVLLSFEFNIFNWARTFLVDSIICKRMKSGGPFRCCFLAVLLNVEQIAYFATLISRMLSSLVLIKSCLSFIVLHLFKYVIHVFPNTHRAAHFI